MTRRLRHSRSPAFKAKVALDASLQAGLRRIRFKDPITNKILAFSVDNYVLSALTIPELPRCRGKLNLFFKWIKRHLHIKSFFGASEKADKTQLSIAVLGCVIVNIVKNGSMCKVVFTKFSKLSASLCSRGFLGEAAYEYRE